MVDWTEVGVIVAAATLLISVLVLVGLRGARLAKMEGDISYLRRDMDSVLRYFKLVPAADQDKRRRGQG